MRTSFVLSMLGMTAITACHAPAPKPAPNEAAKAAPSKTRRPPPIPARNCSTLSQDELDDASDYFSRVTRFRKLYPEDATDAMQQRDISGDPGRVVGVILYLPAERGMNRAYLERLLYCHAVRPKVPEEHPNDPLLADGILFVDIRDAPGGEYQIRIISESRQDAKQLLDRAQALREASGSVKVKQLDP